MGAVPGIFPDRLKNHIFLVNFSQVKNDGHVTYSENGGVVGAMQDGRPMMGRPPVEKADKILKYGRA